MRERWREFTDDLGGQAEPQFSALVARRCLGCGEAEHGDDPLLPFGSEPTGHAWLHSRCWEACHASRRAEAVAALSTLESA